MRALPLVAVTAFASACVVAVLPDATFTKTNRPPRPMRARSVESVELLTTGVPTRAYTEVGMIRAEANGRDGMSDAITAMREKAAAVGCDGVIVTSTGSGSYGHVAYGGACFLYAESTTWQPPASGPDSLGCEAKLAELRAAPNDAKPALVERMPPDCLAAREN